MKQISRFRIKELANIVVFAASLLSIILYIFILSQRLIYPYDIEWAEGAALNQVLRILSEEPLYVKPSTAFSPLVYTPLYYVLSAGLSSFIGTGFLPLRLISATSSIGAAILIYWIVKKETGNNFAGWISACLYIACFDLADGFYDLSRVDSLYVLVLLFSLIILLRTQNLLRIGAAGLIIAAGFFIKQSAIIVFLPLIIITMVLDAKKYWPLMLTSILGISLPWIFMDLHSDGLFSYYIFTLPGQHGYSLISAVNFWVGDILRPLGIAIGFITFYVFFVSNNKIGKDQNEGLDNERLKDSLETPAIQILVFAIGALGASWVTRASNGGGGNNGMAAYAAISLSFGLGYDRVLSFIQEKIPAANLFDIFAPLLVLFQFIGLIYNPFKYLPTEVDYSLNRRLVEIMSAEDKILVPYRSHLSAMQENESQIHIVNLFELTGYFKGDVLPEGKAIVNQIKDEICAQEYGMIVLDGPIPWFEPELTYAYEKVEMNINEVGDGLIWQSQVTDWQQGYKNIFYPKSLINEGCQ